MFIINNNGHCNDNNINNNNTLYHYYASHTTKMQGEVNRTERKEPAFGTKTFAQWSITHTVQQGR